MSRAQLPARPPRRVAVLQSNYIPWKGYFDIIHGVDLFVFYDDVQYTKNDWRNRNRIKTAQGPIWLTVPTGADLHQRICDIRIPPGPWPTKHLKSLRQNYFRARHFEEFHDFLEEVYVGRRWETLSELNQYLIRTIAGNYLGITGAFADSRQYSLSGVRQDRLLDLLSQLGATSYVSGPSGRSYIEAARFADAGIDLEFKDYGGYPEYPQFFPPFDHHVSILDLLFHTGREAPEFIWSSSMGVAVGSQG